MGRLFEDTKYTTLIAKLKSDGIPMYKRNVMILTNPVAAKKNVSINTVTYEWAPPVHNQALVSYWRVGGRRRLFVVIVTRLFIYGSSFCNTAHHHASLVSPEFPLY